MEYIGAPMQMVLPRCETALKVYDTAAFGDFYEFPRDSVKLQKLIDQFRRYSDRNHDDEQKWSPDLKAYIVGQAVGPLGIDNEALRTFGFGKNDIQMLIHGSQCHPFLHSTQKVSLIAATVNQGCMTVEGAMCVCCTCANKSDRSFPTDAHLFQAGVNLSETGV